MRLFTAVLLLILSVPAYAGRIVTWGDPGIGAPPAGNDWVEVRGNYYGAIARKANGNWQSWGIPQLTASGTRAVSVVMGVSVAGVVRADGTAYLFGADPNPSPNQLISHQAGPYLQLGIGGNCAGGLLTDGTLTAWGIFAGSSLSYYPQTPPYASLTYDRDTIYALTTTGHLDAWGHWGASAGGFPGTWSAIDGGDQFMVGIRSGELATIGSNYYGEGNPPAGTGWSMISAGGQTGYAIRAGRLYAWGYDNLGQVSNVPVGDNYLFVDGGRYFGLAIQANPGDANLDGRVDGLDLQILANNWQGAGKGWGDGDFNADSVVDGMDLQLLSSQWQGGPTAAMVPEPASLVLLLVGMGLMSWKRKRGGPTSSGSARTF